MRRRKQAGESRLSAPKGATLTVWANKAQMTEPRGNKKK